MKRLALLLCLLGAPLSAQIAGNDIAAACDHIKEADVRAGYCIGYIAGAWEGMKRGTAQVVMLSDPGKTAAEVDASTNALLGICMPVEVEHSQIVDVFLKYLDDTPSQRHFPARSLLHSALLDAFPCRK
tara:strand:- start:129 stop:515 length:387 start_codon:yes stop_codon:yes gene_type:complete